MRSLRVATLALLVGSYATAVLAQVTPAPTASLLTPETTRATAAVLAQPAEPDVCATQHLSTVIRCIWHDVRQIGNYDSLDWLAFGTVVGGGSVLLDDEVVKAMWDDRQDTSVNIGEYLGEAGLHFGAATAVYALSRATGHQDLADFSVMLIRTQTVNAALTRGLKLIPRPRPYQTEATLTKGSFPSGHTSSSFATATLITRRWGPRAGVPAYLVATFVGVTRLQNVHYLSDVTFGAALGVAAGLALDLPGRRVTMAPLLAPDTTGLSVSVDLGAF